MKKEDGNDTERVLEICKNRRVLITKPGVHKFEDYELTEELHGKNGELVLKLKPRDMGGIKKKINKLVNEIAKNLGEPNSNVVKGLLRDKLGDSWDETIDRMYKLVVEEKKPVKAKEGCFKICIGDQRRKESIEIMLRD